ncbi:hypothetical protein EJ02DRAFT_357992 [Clathrospora elynae]|uniref:Uncharacterized protein n=1 Tax=Clathrospora elynae TaxID=706981 RepID=A0A6A5SHQ2_9PLEO|nr:hypothetical protein EJ02DRAFT_357992 [Clathrospora elynae]
MAGIVCCWASLPDETIQWYEDEWIPNMRSRSDNAIHGLHCEVTASGMETEPVGKLDSPWPLMTVYDMRKLDASTEEAIYDKRKRPSDDLLAGPLKDAQLDIRTYHEIKRWEQEDWNGDIEDIASVAAMEWRVSAEEQEDVLKYYMDVVGPTISSSPDVLRFRVFEIENATALQDGSYVTHEKETLHKYFTLVELESEEWPWDVVVDLAEEKKWKAYFETQTAVKWQLSHFLVKRTYPGDSKA